MDGGSLPAPDARERDSFGAESLEMARWQGAMSQLTETHTQHFNALNGTVSRIERDLSDIKLGLGAVTNRGLSTGERIALGGVLVTLLGTVAGVLILMLQA